MNTVYRLLKNKICELFFYTLLVNLDGRIHKHYCWSYADCVEWMACYPAEDRCWIIAGLGVNLIAMRGI